MSASKNKSSSNGLKILWIPGRKRHDRKGVYSSTKKEVNKNYLPQRKNQVWTLGGASEQKKLINLNVNDDVATSSSHIIDPICLAAGTTAMKTCENHLNLNESQDQEKIVDKEIQGTCNDDNVEIDVDDQAYHNAGTMRFKLKKRGSNNTDLDSIEHLSDDEEDSKKNEGMEDDIDSVSMQRMKSQAVGARRRRKLMKEAKKLEKKKKSEDKCVDCLYYSLMCADFPCTIM